MQTGASPQHSLLDVADNLARLDAALFEGLTVRDALGFHLIGPPPEMEHRLAFTEPMFREFASFLVEKYEAVVIDAGRWISDEVVLAALQSASSIFLTITQQFPSIRNAQRYIGGLRRLGFNQEQIKIVVNG
jgi:pilus assembly protein CpaE